MAVTHIEPGTVHSFSHDPLLRFAVDPYDHETLTFAAAIEISRSSSRLPLGSSFGLDRYDFSALLDRYFPSARYVYLHSGLQSRAGQFDEFNDLVQLLLDNRSDESAESRWLSYAIAACCMGDDHLWQDMGLPNRQALSSLLENRFARLFAKNTGGMRWKKFFYKQLCEQHGAVVCRSPTCAECVDYAKCFGSEEEDEWQLR